MDFSDLKEVKIPRRFSQTRIYILCRLRLPDEARETMPRSHVQRCHGDFLLGFSFPPKVGSVYPFEGQLWELESEPIQFPHRYGSHKERFAPIALFKWVGTYIN